jgi:hypothetical protein
MHRYKTESVLSVHAPLLFKYLGCPVEDKINVKILLASMKNLTTFKNWPEAASEYICAGCPLSVGTSLDAGVIRVNLHVLSGLRCDFSGPQAGSCKCFQSIGRGLLERLLELVRIFIETSKKSKIKYYKSNL